MLTIELGSFGNINLTCFKVGPVRENCYLVHGNAAGLLVDPGDEAGEILDYILSHDIVIENIVLTHGHYDHVGAVHTLTEHFKIPCKFHSKDKKLLSLANVYSTRFGHGHIKPPKALCFIGEGEQIKVVDELFVVRHLPGHTKGSIALVGTQISFSGDTLLAYRVGRSDLPGGDALAISTSVSSFLDAVSNECLILPGHGKPWLAADAKLWWRRKFATKP